MGFFERLESAWESVKSVAKSAFSVVRSAAKRIVSAVVEVGRVVAARIRQGLEKLEEMSGEIQDRISRRRHSTAMRDLTMDLEGLRSRVAERLLEVERSPSLRGRYETVMVINRLMQELEKYLREKGELSDVNQCVVKTIQNGTRLVDGDDLISDEALDALAQTTRLLLGKEPSVVMTEYLQDQVIDAKELAAGERLARDRMVDDARFEVQGLRRRVRRGQASAEELELEERRIEGLEKQAERALQRSLSLELIAGVLEWLIEKVSDPMAEQWYEREMADIRDVVQRFLAAGDQAVLSESDRETLGAYAVMGYGGIEERMRSVGVYV